MIGIKEKDKKVAYIDEFLKPSQPHESLLVGYLWRTPSLYEKYRSHKIERETFTKSIWYFYYLVGKQMYESGVRTFDDISTYSFIISRPPEFGKQTYIESYNNFGAYITIEELMNECDKNKGNDEYHFSEIQKFECLRKFQKEGLIDVNNRELIEKLCVSTLKQLQSFVQFEISKIFSSVNCGEVVEYNLLANLDKAIEKLNEGESMGMPLHDSPRLSRIIKGWKRGELMYLVLSSGMGKSSLAMEKFVLSLVEHQYKGMMFTNEENILKAQSLILATTASKILHEPINRGKISEGEFDDNTLRKLNKSKEWLEQHNQELIKFYDMKKYRVEDMLSRLQMMKPLGYNYAILDTFKASSGSDMARWESFSNAAQDIFDNIKPEANNIGMLATVQLKIGKEYRYLDLSAIGKSLEIVEVASVVLMGRLLYADELEEKGKNSIKAYNYYKDEFDGKWKTREYTLDKDKVYMILFISKNRSGSTLEQVIYEVNYDINSFKEVALAKMERKSNIIF